MSSSEGKRFCDYPRGTFFKGAYWIFCLGGEHRTFRLDLGRELSSALNKEGKVRIPVLGFVPKAFFL